jgi:hypothetical protein
MTNRLPSVTPELLTYLDKLFPERSADPSWTDREVWMRAGERRVVRKLIETFNDQTQDSLLNHV